MLHKKQERYNNVYFWDALSLALNISHTKLRVFTSIECAVLFELFLSMAVR